MTEQGSIFNERWPRGRNSATIRWVVVLVIIAAFSLMAAVVAMALQHPRGAGPLPVIAICAILILMLGLPVAMWLERRSLHRGLEQSLARSGWKTASDVFDLLDADAIAVLEKSCAQMGFLWHPCGGLGILGGRRIIVWMNAETMGKRRRTRIGVMCEVRSAIPQVMLFTPFTLAQRWYSLAPMPVGASIVAGRWKATEFSTRLLLSCLSPEMMRFLEWSPRSTCIEALPPYVVVHRILTSNRDAEPDRVQVFIEHAVRAANLLERDLPEIAPNKNPDHGVGVQ